MKPEDLVEEAVVDSRDMVGRRKGEADPDGSDQPQEHTGWLSQILPRMSIPFPSVPALSAKLPFTLRRHPSGMPEHVKADNGGKRRAGKQVKVYHKPTRLHPSMNHLEMSHTNSSLEYVHVTRAPNNRLKAVRDSFPKPSLPKMKSLQLCDPFDCLHGQDIVILGGYRGSILRDAKTRKQLWVPLVKVGLNLRKVDLSIPLDDGADERVDDTVVADGMLSRLGPVDFSNRLITKLRALEKQGKCRVHIFGYDWRISPRLASKKLQRFLEELPCNQTPRARDSGALVIAHSMGGLIAHHALQMRPDLFYGTVYCGTPFIHCINILGPFKRGDALLANRDILASSVNFSMRSSFVFLPEWGECFVDRQTHEKYRLDFFDYKTWVEYGLSPCVSDVGEGKPSQDWSPDGQVDYAEDQVSRVKKTVFYPRKILEPHIRQPPPSGANPPKPKYNREEAIEYLKRTLAETLKFKHELEIQPNQTPLLHPPLAVVYAVNTATVRGALVDGKEGIKQGNWWDFTYGPGDGVVLAKSAQLPDGFVTVAKVKSNRGHLQLMSDLKAMGVAIESVVRAKQAHEDLIPAA